MHHLKKLLKAYAPDDDNPSTGSAGGSPPHGKDADSALRRAREIASRELVPLSSSPRGAVVVDPKGRRAEGSSVEFPAAPRLGVCAEHAALTSAVALGLAPEILAIWTAPDDPSPYPCGVCRQVLAELAADVTIWLQRGEGPPETLSAQELLPRPFDKTSLPARSTDPPGKRKGR
jgi:cytidine deaminase